jgi:hypothetical protein
MRKVIVLFVLLTALQLAAQEKTSVTVKSSEVSSGVVVVTVHQTPATPQDHASVVLQCNKDMPDCKAPVPGTYIMVRLPKNYGVYDCVNVDLFPGGPESGEKVGEYCLIEK